MKFTTFWKTFISEKDAITLLKSADSLSKEELIDIQKLIKKMQSEGKSASVIINHLMKYNDKISDYYKAKRVFDTENKTLQTDSVIASANRLDLNKFEVLLSPDACKTCRAKTQNGNKIFDEREITKDGYGHRPPFHPNCVLGDTVVDAPDASNLLRVKYSGKIIKISLADGRTLSVTQNHIILTDRGFARADLLSEGDYVISSTGIEGVISKQPNDDSSVSTISEIFDASIKSLGSPTDSVPPTPEHLHGDGRFCDSNIDIVSTDSLLGDTIEPRFYKHIKKYFLDSTHLSDSLNSGGNLSSMLITLSLAFDGIVSGSSISSILRFSSSTMNELKGLFNISRYNSRIDKASTYSNSTNSKPMSDTILALSSVIRLDKIINIEVLDFHGYVYDISTVSSLYITNGIISSNCYCVLIPHAD